MCVNDTMVHVRVNVYIYICVCAPMLIQINLP